MIGQVPLLVMLVQLVDRLPPLPPPPKRGRGRPKVYTDHLFLKALVIMIVRHLHTVHELLCQVRAVMWLFRHFGDVHRLTRLMLRVRAV